MLLLFRGPCPSNDRAASSHIPTGAPTDGDFAPAHSTSPSRDPFKGRDVVEPSSLVSKRTKKQLADERQDAIYAKQLEQEEEMSASQKETRQAELLGVDVNEDNFAERMVALINQRKRAFAEKKQLNEKRDRPMTHAQQREYMRVFVKNQTEFEKIRMAVADIKSNELRRTLKRAGEALEPDISKKQKSTEVSTPYVPDVPQPQVVSTSKSSGTRRKFLAGNEAPILWSAFAGWEDLLKLYGLVVKYYENHPVTGAGLILAVGGLLYTLSKCHVWKTVSREYKLEISKDVVGNDMTTAAQLIRFIKNQLAAAQVSPA
ncbi:hypothetical protein Tco_0390942 [Tanacetum coccineum]